jgi:hypothetical protein
MPLDIFDIDISMSLRLADIAGFFFLRDMPIAFYYYAYIDAIIEAPLMLITTISLLPHYYATISFR